MDRTGKQRAGAAIRPAGWAVYDRLLAGVPAESRVRRYLAGQAWAVVESQGPGPAGMGLAMSLRSESGVRPEGLLRPSRAGTPLRELAADLRSWDVGEASLGLAAVNSHYNQRERLETLLDRDLTTSRCEPVFVTMADEVAGKRVAVIGHFPGLEELASLCTLSILERCPQPGDLPDPACEYVLPEQDYVFITGTTIINKTLPRLLQLCSGARVVLVGPSVPFTPAWFEWGVDVLAGSVVVDSDACWITTCEGGVHEIWSAGAVRLQVRREDFARPRALAQIG